MSLQSQQRRLVVMVSRKRERWPTSDGEESPLLAPLTPPAADKKRSFDEDEDLWGVEMPEWGDVSASEIQQPNKRSRDRFCWTHDDSLLFLHQDPKDSSNFPEDFSPHVPFAMSAADLSSEESYNIGERSKLLTLSQEDCLEDIANSATPVTPSPVVSGAADDEPAAIQQTPTIRDIQSGEPEDEGSSNLCIYGKPGQLSVGENNVGSSP